MPGACCCCREGCKAGRQEALIGEYRSYLALFFFFPGGGVSFRAPYLGPGEMSAVLAVAVHPQYPLGFILGRALGCVPLHPAPPPPKSWLCLSRSPGVLGLLFPCSPRECSAEAQEVPARNPAELEANLSFHPCHRSSLRIISVGFNSELNFPALNGVSALLGP